MEHGPATDTQGLDELKGMCPVKDLSKTQDLHDSGHIKYLESQITNISSKLTLPLCACSFMVIPNVPPRETGVVYNVLHTLINSTSMIASGK